ncbi:FIG00556587: hypothetical protein [uncultured Synechococcales cyanobacterium]|uniref:Uncharacterized protein n=1 Tax=uncultured Synechococcales cyanobacterium TaxID=1936017 RepID=A0A6J4VU21_9CYAN|nr:FIG00556587: hypothetical protein [uncultured Synechococcales cyanobacterium]
MAAPNPSVMQAVERLGYRVTIGDVAAQAGLNTNLAQQELLALASDAGGHLQVAESGEIAYQFPRNFRAVLRNKFFRLRLKDWWAKVWRVLFYLIRISFGIVLLLSIVLILVAIAAIVLALNASRGDNDRDSGYSGGGGFGFLPNLWVGPDLFWFFSPNPYGHHPQARGRRGEEKSMNFLESIFSFLFGDGNPNADLEARRWQTIGSVIRNNGGAIAAEQVAPYLNISAQNQADEAYILPVLSRFNGQPEVSPQGEIVYRFPELQSTASRWQPRAVAAYLRELPWKFSQATSGQKLMAIGLGSVNLIGALVLGSLLRNSVAIAQAGAFITFIQSIFVLLLAYGIAFLTIPLLRYFWIQWRNRKVADRNQKRQEWAIQLNQADPNLQQKLAYARQFAAETIVSRDDLAYTSEESLLEQEANRSAAIDAEWQRRLDQSGS